MGIGAVRNHSLSKKHQSQTTLKDVTNIHSCFASGGASTSTSSLFNVLHTICSADTSWTLEMVKWTKLQQ